MKIITLLLAASFVSQPVFASTSPSEVIQFLKQKMNSEKVLMMGHSREEAYPCGIEFEANDNELLATFFYPSGSGKDVRGVFRITSATKVKTFDQQRNEILVSNKYAQSGRRKKVTRLSRIVVEMNAKGTPSYINIGWGEDNGYPIGMYGCAID